jgi:arginyl-tRNA synthetase
MEAFGVDYDVWFSERDLHHSGAVDDIIERLRESGHAYVADDAVWLRTTDFGDDKDRVLLRADGRPTYFAADCAYMASKFAAASTAACTSSARTTTGTSSGFRPSRRPKGFLTAAWRSSSGSS